MGLDGLKSPYHATNNRTTLVRKRRKEGKEGEEEEGKEDKRKRWKTQTLLSYMGHETPWHSVALVTLQMVWIQMGLMDWVLMWSVFGWVEMGYIS